METMTKLSTEELQRITAYRDQAKKSWLAAVQKAENAMSDYNTNTVRLISESEKNVADFQIERDKLTRRRGQAIVAGNKSLADELRDQIDVIDYKIGEAQSELEALKYRDATREEKSFIFEAVIEFSAAFDAAKKAEQEVGDFCKKVEEELERLEKLLKEGETTLRYIGDAGSSGTLKKLITMYQKAIGKDDACFMTDGALAEAGRKLAIESGK